MDWGEGVKKKKRTLMDLPENFTWNDVLNLHAEYCKCFEPSAKCNCQWVLSDFGNWYAHECTIHRYHPEVPKEKLDPHP